MQAPTTGKKLSAAEKRSQRHNKIIKSTNIKDRMPIPSAESVGKDDPFKQHARIWESPMTASTGESNRVCYKGFVEWGDADHSTEQTASASDTDPMNHLEERNKHKKKTRILSFPCVLLIQSQSWIARPSNKCPPLLVSIRQDWL
jgi:hypothetical protein